MRKKLENLRFQGLRSLNACDIIERITHAGGLPLVRYNPHVIFVEPKEKQRGIRYFQQLLSIPDEDIVVFGDGMNDICMFGQGWLSIAMGNARAALKEKPGRIIAIIDGGALSKTGASVAIIASVAAAMLAVGAGVMALRRKRS